MIKHIVMWTLREYAEGKHKKENLYLMKTQLESLKDKIAGIQKLEVGINCNRSSDACDIVLYTEFKTIEDLDIYQDHPAHVNARDFIRKVRLERKVVDFEIE